MEVQINQTQSLRTSPPYRTYAEISVSQLAANYHCVESTLPTGTRMMPVVKANAYGHGAVEVARKLVECGAKWLAVSCTEEGVELRESGILPPVRIVVTAGILPLEWSTVLEHSLTPVLHSLSDVEFLENLCKTSGNSFAFHFKVDTGLSRLGSTASPEAIAAVFQTLRYARPEGLMTHFASASGPLNHQTQNQIHRFGDIVSELRNRGITIPILHVDATDSLHHPPHDGGYQLVRPGLSMYGYVTQPEHFLTMGALSVKPVLSWHARVLLTKQIPTATDVGYGALHRTTRPTKIAVLAVGYADGYPHKLSGVGRVLLRGQAAPILGAISMDLTTVDVTDIPDVRNDDIATLIGSDGKERIDALDLARMTGTISYAILTNIQGRVKRVYRR